MDFRVSEGRRRARNNKEYRITLIENQIEAILKKFAGGKNFLFCWEAQPSSHVLIRNDVCTVFAIEPCVCVTRIV